MSKFYGKIWEIKFGGELNFKSTPSLVEPGEILK